MQELVEQKYVLASRHNSKPLTIYNYSKTTQFEGFWTPLTRKTRGLILDDEKNIVVEPPEKFFNLGEPLAPDIELSRARILEKLDGFMIICKLDSDYGLIVASRGSFNSKYAEAAKTFIDDNILLKMVPNYTYFCELLQNFPGDAGKILAEYPIPKLVCWAIKDENFNEVGLDDECPFPTVQELSLAEAKEYLKQKVEGVVAQDTKTFERVKIKTEWYITNHRLASKCTPKRVWETLVKGQRVEDLDIPDEFMPQMKKWQDDFLNQYQSKYNQINRRYIQTSALSDKELAFSPDVPADLKSLVFSKRDNKSQALQKAIWDRIRKNDIM